MWQKKPSFIKEDISEIAKEKEVVDCSKLFVINVTSMTKGKEIYNDYVVKVHTDQPSTLKVHDLDQVTVEDCRTDSDDEKVDADGIYTNNHMCACNPRV